MEGKINCKTPYKRSKFVTMRYKRQRTNASNGYNAWFPTQMHLTPTTTHQGVSVVLKLFIKYSQ